MQTVQDIGFSRLILRDSLVRQHPEQPSSLFQGQQLAPHGGDSGKRHIPASKGAFGLNSYIGKSERCVIMQIVAVLKSSALTAHSALSEVHFYEDDNLKEHVPALC
ncbi:hypothetical protein LOAG_01503 [Loa loa]|uniref:Uncharacterized protein n=1 Tax=Loa loa TaxID=7209 RepID=A0A1S0U9B6_LOALO|nr:hypothetical protein LOAG_01503 [Loa loa]EFO26988.1 hypothetical protein LOAG_01503 [Loa loa]